MSQEVITFFNSYLRSPDPYLSRQFLPYLQVDGPDRDYLLEQFLDHASLLLAFDFLSEEFDLLEPKLFDKIFTNAIAGEKYELAYSIGKEMDYFNLCCKFDEFVHPKFILEELNSHLKDKNMVSCYIPEANLSDMLYYGLVPCPEMFVYKPIYRDILEMYQEGFDRNEIAYWNEGKSLTYLNGVGFWSLVTLDYVKNETKIGNSYCASLLFPKLLYTSMRPKTDMSMFQTAVSNTYINTDEIPDKNIAVTRYAKGMSKGLFYGDRPKGICGLFYYSEPESTTYLSYRKSFTAFNKTVAALKLLKIQNDRELSTALRQLSFHGNGAKKARKHIKGKLPADLRFTPNMAEDLLDFNGKQKIESNRKVYLGNRQSLNLYAYEDSLDQPLCKLAAGLGYDLVILTHMVGSHQVVTEVLDTRPDSMKYLWFLK